MNNLYIWFPDDSARREFFLELTGLKVYDPATGKTLWNVSHMTRMKMCKPKPGELDRWLNPLEFGKMSSPYLNMKPLTGPDNGPEYLKKNRKPWQPFALMERGLHRVYTLRSYRGRPGHWLVLRFFDNPVGRTNRQWVLKRIPPAQIGFHVKPSDGASPKHHLTWAATVLNRPLGEKLPAEKCLEVYDRLIEVLSKDRNLFVGDGADLWENLAYRFSLVGDIGRCKRCCHIQASLQPGSSDAWLNLGQYYNSFGLRDDALAAYRTGITINPNDEYIHYNMASLLYNSGNSKKALAAINKAILSNSDRGLNFWLKGRLHAQQGNHHAAAKSFRHTIRLMKKDGYEGWEKVLAAAYESLAESLEALDEPDEAADALMQARKILNPDEDSLFAQGRG